MTYRFRRRLFAALPLSIALLIPACLGETDDVTPVLLPSPTATFPIATPSIEVGPTATATYTAALDAMLVPGPLWPLPDAFFFAYGTDIWVQPAEENARRLVADTAVEPWAQSPDGTRVATVILTEEDGEERAEIRVVGLDGESGTPVYGPIAVGTGGDAPEISHTK